MATAEFSKCPTAWIIKRNGLKAFRVPEVGTCIAALKVYLAIVIRANYYPTKEYPHAGSALLSYTQIAELLDLSRVMIARGIKKLEAVNQFSMRHRAHLNALKLYLLFIAFRNNNTNATKIAYETIGEYTGIANNDIHPAISVLIDLSLIDVDRSPSHGEKVNQPNLYHIRGLTSRFKRVVEDVDPAAAKDFAHL